MSSTYGTSSQVVGDFDQIISPTKLNALLATVAHSAPYYVVSTDGDTSVTSDFPGLPGQKDDVILVDPKQAVSDDLDQAAQPQNRNAFGIPTQGLAQDATYVTNNFTDPVIVYATKSAFVELQGSATVYGGNAQTFVADASHDASPLDIKGSDAANSYSWILGGSGSDTLTGSSSSTGTTVINAGSGATTADGGNGAATIYGGGHTTMYAGNGDAGHPPHGGQVLLEFNAGSSDSMVANAGGSNFLGTAAGANYLDDRLGKGPDSTGAGADTLGSGGDDTLYGSEHGTVMALYSGSSSVLSAGSDTIYAAGGGNDTITASTKDGVFDTVQFVGHTASEIQGLVDSQNQAGATNVTISFNNTDGSKETATLNNYRDSAGNTHIQFIG